MPVMLLTTLSVTLLAIISVYSELITFRHATISLQNGTSIAVNSSNNLKDHLPVDEIEEIWIKGDIPVLYENSVADIHNIKTFYFYANGIKEIRPGAFKNLHGVENLHLDVTKFKTLKRNIFNDVETKLLSISNNVRLERIEEGALDNPHIEELWLKSNALKSFSKNVFRKMPNLKTLILQRNNLKTIQVEVFAGLPLETLSLSENRISRIPANFTHRLPKLAKFFFDENKLTKINNKLFKNHPSLQDVSFNYNRISSIDADAFDNIPHLQYVNLRWNKISRIDSSWFNDCPNVNWVSFERNWIEKLDDDSFRNLVNNHTVTIILAANHLKKISSGAFRGLTSVGFLDFHHCSLEKWSDDFLVDVEEIYALKLQDNNLKCLEGDFDDLFKANVTYLSGNPLSAKCLSRIEEWRKSEAAVGRRVCTNQSPEKESNCTMEYA